MVPGIIVGQPTTLLSHPHYCRRTHPTLLYTSASTHSNSNPKLKSPSRRVPSRRPTPEAPPLVELLSAEVCPPGGRTVPLPIFTSRSLVSRRLINFKGKIFQTCKFYRESYINPQRLKIYLLHKSFR